MGTNDATDGPRRWLEGLPLAALAGIGTGLGGLAFFTFMGGAITVARFRGAGLSGTKAVALVPKSDLLAVGAQACLLPTLIGVAALVPFVFSARDRCRRRVVLIVLGLAGFTGGIVRIASQWSVYDWSWDEWTAVAALFVIAVSGGLAVEELAKGSEIPKPSPWHDKRKPGSRAPATGLLFLIVALFVAVESYGVAYARPGVHPMAILRANGQDGLSGIYVGESNNRVWIGQVVLDPPGSDHGDKSAGRIIGLPRSEVSDIAIGALRPLGDADSERHQLLRTLHREHARCGVSRGMPREC